MNQSTVIHNESLRTAAAPIRLLIVEDDEYYARVLRRNLSKREDGFVVTWVDRLSTGLRVLEQDSFDLILTDLTLPDAQGLASFQAIHALRSDVPIVILSSDGNVDTALEAVSQGAQDFLVKERISYDSIARCIRYTIERRNAEQSRLRLEAINDFVAMLAHDLNIPLLAADRVLELLLSAPLSEEQRLELLRKLKAANQDQLSKVRRMLEAYRYETVESAIHMENVDLIDVIRRCLILVETRYPERLWKLNFMAPSRPAVLRCNIESMELVFSNLLDNSIRYGPDGQEISIEVQVTDRNLMVTISDEGPGIKEDLKARIFKHVWHGTPGKTYATTGKYGLYLCHKIARLHKGSIACSDNQPKGTTITLSLPTV